MCTIICPVHTSFLRDFFGSAKIIFKNRNSNYSNCLELRPTFVGEDYFSLTFFKIAGTR